MAISLWGVRRRKRRIPRGFIDRKRAAFFAAAVRRYAWHDHELVSVRELAAYAGASVDTFYNRFGSQRAFWYAVATAHFQATIRAMNAEFDPKALGDISPQMIIRRISEHVMNCMAGDTIGITRMAMRFATTAPLAADAFNQYRSALTDRAVELLAPKLNRPGREGEVRTTMSAILGMAADTSWHHNGPLLSSERELMIDRLTRQICRSLRIRTIKRVRSQTMVDRETGPTSTKSPNEALGEADLPIYRKSLQSFENAVHESRRPQVVLSGDSIDPEDARIVSLLYEQPKPRERRPVTPKPRFALL